MSITNNRASLVVKGKFGIVSKKSQNVMSIIVAAGLEPWIFGVRAQVGNH